MKTVLISVFALLLFSCNNKKPEIPAAPPTTVTLQKPESESIEGVYETQPDPSSSDECSISVAITKVNNGYSYFLQTKERKVKGKATFATNESGEKYIVLEGIKWDEYEGDITNQQEEDSISDAPELEIPVGIGANYVKDTLTIQNYGNAMNSYTKISECGRKYIQLIKSKK
jgi:hypothetical protein